MKSVPLVSQNNLECTASLPFSQHSRYDAYLIDIQDIYRQIGLLMTEAAVAVVEVANLKKLGTVTPLAWDIAHTISQVLHFEGEVVIEWEPTYAYGYDHSYCLLFTRPPN